MKHIAILLPIILLVSCVHNPWNDVSQIYRPVEVEEPDPIVLVVEDIPPMEDVELPPLPTPHEAWLEMKDVWDEMELAKLEAFPGYEVQEYPVLDPDLPEVEVEIEPEVIPEPEPIVPEPIVMDPTPAPVNGVTLGATELPSWFVYIVTVLILATLIALCYIAKQRKESSWYRRERP